VLIDGLNTFHALKAQNADLTNLDFQRLVGVLYKDKPRLELDVFYFTALVEHMDKQSRKIQFAYIEKLRESGVKVVVSEFRSQLEKCFTCGVVSRRYTEKQTDVALAATLISQVIESDLDDALIFSADSDFLPAIFMAQKLKPKLRFKVVSTTSYLRPLHGALTRAGVGTIRLSTELVSKNLFS
jgi:uncharacterized LabA/DUF88 family protein